MACLAGMRIEVESLQWEDYGSHTWKVPCSSQLGLWPFTGDPCREATFGVCCVNCHRAVFGKAGCEEALNHVRSGWLAFSVQLNVDEALVSCSRFINSFFHRHCWVNWPGGSFAFPSPGLLATLGALHKYQLVWAAHLCKCITPSWQ